MEGIYFNLDFYVSISKGEKKTLPQQDKQKAYDRIKRSDIVHTQKAKHQSRQCIIFFPTPLET